MKSAVCVVRTQVVLIVAMLMFLCGNVFAATYYVDGAQTSDTGSGQTWATAKKYIYSGIQLMSSGDTLIVKDGTYTNNLDRIRGLPSGTTNNYTTIKAETDFGVVLSGLTAGTALAPEEAIVNVYQKSWVSIEGFIIKDCKGSGIYTLSAIQMTNSDHCRIRKVGIKNGVQPLAEYGGGISTSGSSYCLFEDIFICGMMRYGINVGGGSTNHHNILRRVVVRWDYCTTAQPRAAITAYGASQGQTPNNNILMQNCIVIDGNLGSGTTFTGGFSLPHETSYIQRYGCISLNNRGYGFHSSEDSLSHDNTNTQCVVWDSNSGMWWRHLASGTSGAYNCTFEQTGPTGSSDTGRGAYYECEAVNNVLTNGATINNMTLSGNVSNALGDFTYIVQSPTSGKGATILKKMGITGTLWDETGYNTLSDDNLWPFPYEDNIRGLFQETNTPPINVSPTTNDATRGFCADNRTLTSYIWEYLGNASPVLYAPKILNAAAISTSQIGLSWEYNAVMVKGFKIERKNGADGVYVEIADVGAGITSYTDNSLAAGINYYYRIRAYNLSFVSDYSPEAIATTNYIPAAPSNLTAAASSPYAALLNWQDNAVNETGFKIERKTGLTGTYLEIADVAADTLAYSDGNLIDGATYYYRVRAYNSYYVSEYSAEASVTLNYAVNAPSNLSALPLSSSSIVLSWSDNAGNETGFNIERKTGLSNAWAEIANVAADSVSYADNVLLPNTTYYYRIRAYNAYSVSDYSGEAMAKTADVVTIANVVVNAPSGLIASPLSSSSIVLTWTDNADNEAGFKIERKKWSSGTYAQIATVSANTIKYTDTGLRSKTTYYYRIKAYNSNTESAYCNEANATTNGRKR